MSSKNPIRNVTGDKRREIIYALKEATTKTGHNLWQTFQHFIEVNALAIREQTPITDEQRKQVAERYAAIEAQYTPEAFHEIARALLLTASALKSEPGDVLGDCFMGMDLGSSWAGQFFTPFDVAMLSAALVGTPEIIKEHIARDEVYTLHDPAIGAGSMPIACIELLKQQGIDYRSHLLIHGIDIDIKCVHMAFIQFSLLGAPAIIVHGNSLSLDVWDTWFTPAFYPLAIAREKRGESVIDMAAHAQKNSPQLVLFPNDERIAS